jgi:hypothetical protein
MNELIGIDIGGTQINWAHFFDGGLKASGYAKP